MFFFIFLFICTTKDIFMIGLANSQKRKKIIYLCKVVLEENIIYFM